MPVRVAAAMAGAKKGRERWAERRREQQRVRYRRARRASTAYDAYAPSTDGSRDGSPLLDTKGDAIDMAPPPPRKRRKPRREDIACFGDKRHRRFVRACAELRDNTTFQAAIIGVIVVAGVQVGLQLYPLDDSTLRVLDVVDAIILVVFIGELVIKFAAEGRFPMRFFRSGWNCFDFVIVVVGVLPFGGSAVTALRLVRLLRVLKLVRALPKLQILVMGLLKSMSSIGYIGLLLGLLFYLYGVLGVSLLGANDPVHMGNLHTAIITLFRSATLEDWTDVMYIGMFSCANYGYGAMQELCTHPSEQFLLSIAFFVSFIILSAMMILNLFIGVITSSMSEAKSEVGGSTVVSDDEYDQPTDEQKLEERVQELADTMARISANVAGLFDEHESHRMHKESGEESPGKVLLAESHRLNEKLGSPATLRTQPVRGLKRWASSLRTVTERGSDRSARANAAGSARSAGSGPARSSPAEDLRVEALRRRAQAEARPSPLKATLVRNKDPSTPGAGSNPQG